MGVTTAERFLFGYSVFLFFLVFLISLGFQGLEGNVGNLIPPTLPNQPDLNLITYLLYVFENIGFFFTLMTINTSILFISLLIFSPAVITLIYILVKLIRGGG